MAFNCIIDASSSQNKASEDSAEASSSRNKAFENTFEAYSIDYETPPTSPDASSSSTKASSVERDLNAEFDRLFCSYFKTVETVSQPKNVEPPVYPVWDRFCFRKPDVGMQHAQLTKELLMRECTGKPFPMIEQHGPDTTRERFGDEVWNIHDLMQQSRDMKNPPEMVDGVVDELNARGPPPGEMSKFLIKMMKDEARYVGKRLYEQV
ncbi:uncharacterized protein PODANS_3_2815 [Podospora anserina S mat+]|uniref:Podospora anserina S mat+ genomic DNA chromosome 3, supercontig 2 n=1 Tax=Podospora anserina (strain S / ATCC MYA-4624 / DSM 980 / FGSC 10383) TaxID=515849 RepID=B2AZT5_PODAN|nr:uncharacterized protein PODANS_3_2815 [Podospora anserina S mat+]CAP70185.1 unnamed protein product [Podospora anserina S mat+]CDP26778.1 Putative protein of unknown function [Podospora anserina S mat+]